MLENRVEVAQFVEAFIAKYGQYDNWIGISSRPKGYEGDARLQLARVDLAILEVLPLQPSGIRSLIGKLLPLLEPNPHQRQEDFTRLTTRILANSNLTEIAGVPLFCSALVQVYKYHGAELPQRRVDVLAEIVDLLLGFWYAQQSDIRDPEKLARADGTTLTYNETGESVEQKHNRLAHLAYYMQANLGQAEISSELAQKQLEVYLAEHEGIALSEARRWAKNFLRSAHEQSGLFVESNPGSYTFLHKNFMEYFAASSILQDQDEPLEVILQHLEDEWWEQVVLLAASHPKTTTPFRKKLIPTILEKSKAMEKDSSKWLRNLTMAGWMARDMTTRLPAPQREEIEQALYESATDASLKPTSRAQLAEVLDGWWLPRDLHTFVQLDVFLIYKYPVTNAQYERFLQPENFADQELWCDFPKFDEKSQRMKDTWKDQGWQWLQQASTDENYLFEAGILYPRYWRDSRFGFLYPGKPVVGVSWYEANAYCKWLARNWNELEEGKRGFPVPGVVRLPTEAEWALAAGGDRDENRFPWDDKGVTTDLQEILKRANVSESGIARTTPVWMYPLGVNPDGAMDMSGNVWEWQANYTHVKNGWLGLRGGSWNYFLDYARVAYRSFDLPDFRYFNLGFRVVCLPS